MDTSANKCPICNEEAKISSHQNFAADIITCPHCGKYIMECDILNNGIDLKLRSCLSYYLTQKWHNEILIPHFYDYNSGWIDGKVENQNRYTVSIKSLLNLYPKTISDKIDMILLNIATRIKYIGNTFIACISENRNLYVDFFIDDTYGKGSIYAQFSGLVNILEELEMIKQVESDYAYTYTLTVKGWNRVQELQSENIQSSQAFIAMWFDESMEEARKNIISAITDCGYVPVIIDDKEHNHQIVPEIFFEIKQSSFIIADLTGQRTGVYYEAGYAEALSKEVILSCREDSFKDRHFDVAQKNTVVWKDENDLYQRLCKRIEATVGIRK